MGNIGWGNLTSQVRLHRVGWSWCVNGGCFSRLIHNTLPLNKEHSIGRPSCLGVWKRLVHCMHCRCMNVCLVSYHYLYHPHNVLPADPLPDMAPELLKTAVREKWAIYTLRSGLQSLPLAMLSALEERGVKVHLDTPCTSLQFRDQSAQVYM